MTTLDSVVTEIQQRLGDSAGQIWTSDEITDYVKEGYNDLTLETGCLWETACLPDYAYAFNYTAEFERELIEAESEQLIAGIAQFTAEFERDFVDNALGPANHTAFWEFDDGYVTETLVSGLVELPENLHQIERATWNTKKIMPLRSRELEQNDSRYELDKGEVLGYAMDKDGLDVLRKWRVPSAAYTPYTFLSPAFTYTFDYELTLIEALGQPVLGKARFTQPFEADFVSTADAAIAPANHTAWFESYDSPYGILRVAGDISDEVVIGGEWGILRRIPGEMGTASEWGTVRAVYKEANNVRIEYQRRGSDLDENTPFEIPDRSVKYVMHFVLWKALIRDGPGQMPELAVHYKQRYDTGVARMIRRKTALQYQKKTALGGSRNIRNTRLPLARLPYQYGQVVR